jgi:hypothetical protein
MPSYSDIKELYNDIKTDKVMKIIARIFFGCAVLAFLVTFILFLIDGGNGKHVKYIYGLFERNIPKGYPDTVYRNIFIHDTTFLERTVFSKSTPKKEAGTSIRDINAKNAAVGDNNKVGDNITYNEKELTEADKPALIAKIEEVKKQNNATTNCVTIISTTNSNGGKVAAQIESFLKSQGYIIQGHGMSFGTLNGVQIGYDKSCIRITVGTL